MPSTLFSPIDLRGLHLKNRVAVAPMCQYSAVEGTMTDWHLMHLGTLSLSGASLLIIEATGVSPKGRITPGCTGLYSDENEAEMARIVEYCRSISDTKIGIQLGHAGRKASTRAPWLDGGTLTEEEGAWIPEAPSAVPYLPQWREPDALDAEGLAAVKAAFVQAAKRAARIGLDLIELHGAHGYLLHQFLSPLSNTRTDEYGGDLAGRMRFPLEVFEAVRAEVPEQMPVLVRLSATDWVEGGWDVDQSAEFCRELKALGCDMIHVSSGGLHQNQAIVPGPGYQVRFSAELRERADIPTMAVGEIDSPRQAETILRSGQADMVALARGMLWDPRWMWKAAVELNEEISLPAQYARCNPALRGKPFVKR